MSLLIEPSGYPATGCKVNVDLRPGREQMFSCSAALPDFAFVWLVQVAGIR